MLQCIVACWLRVETGLICTQHIPPNQSATDCSALQHTETHCNTLQHTATHCNTLQRRDRGVYSIWGGRSLYCLHFDISQLIEPEACFGIFVWVSLGWLSKRSLYQTIPVNPSLLYQAVGTQANVAKIPFKLKGQIEKIFRRLLVSPRLGTKGTDLLELSCTSFGCLVNRAILVQISQNKLRVPQDD